METTKTCNANKQDYHCMNLRFYELCAFFQCNSYCSATSKSICAISNIFKCIYMHICLLFSNGLTSCRKISICLISISDECSQFNFDLNHLIIKSNDIRLFQISNQWKFEWIGWKMYIIKWIAPISDWSVKIKRTWLSL